MPALQPHRAQQQALPLDPPPPSPAAVQAELKRLWRARPLWQRRWPSLEALLGEPWRAKALMACAQQLLVQRQREALHGGRRLRPTTTK